MTRTNAFGQPIGEPVSPRASDALPDDRHSGATVRLLPLRERYADDVVRVLGSHPELWTYQPDEPPASAAEAAAGIDRFAAAADTVPYAIVDRAAGFAGRVAYLRIQPAIGTIEIGAIIYAPWFQRTRAATEVQYLLLRHAFDLGYRRCEWKCDSLNLPSRTAATRLGFTEEGTWRNALIVKGRNRDTTWFSITDDDWPAVRAGFEAWLDDANFDDHGVQRRSLAEVRGVGRSTYPAGAPGP